MPRLRSSHKRVLNSSQAARAPRRSSAGAIARKPTYFGRLLAAILDHYQECDRSYISEDALIDKVREKASDLNEELGKRFDSMARAALMTLRRNHYVEYKSRRANKSELEDRLRITENTETILRTVGDVLDVYTGLTELEIHRLTCNHLQSQIQAKSKKLPTRVELDKENRILEETNRELVQENRELQDDLAELRGEPMGDSSIHAPQPLQRQDTLIVDDQHTHSTSSNPSLPTFEIQGPTPHHSLTQTHLDQTRPQTPSRQPLQQSASFYLSPESPGVGRSGQLQPSAGPSRLARTNSQLHTPPSTPDPPQPRSRMSSPSISSPGALDDGVFDDDDMDIDPAPTNLDIDMRLDEDREVERILAPSLPIVAGSRFHCPTPDPSPARPQRLLDASAVQTDVIQPLPCADCTARTASQVSRGIQSDAEAETFQSCAQCEEKDIEIAEKNTELSRANITIRAQDIRLNMAQTNLVEASQAQATLEAEKYVLTEQLRTMTAA